ncbi:chloride channel protein [Lactobacillus kalixensis]|uniref:Chloride channel protein n=1 Tax=Lactobacillus kalixensis DSM 16043 TaxID=1423763 RepID=A0A0R1UAX9_9LACO|nr:chloride channel protein [Lactobacillus kalixensis]KRL90497.1 hypothetical protein FC46_GL001942 [Lactobacillus kalixensis DSM 16043]
MKIWKINQIVYAIVWSFIIGIVTAGYLNLVNWIIHLVWQNYSGLSGMIKLSYPFLVCLPFGLVIGILNKKLGDYPLTIEQVLTQVRMNGKINYRNWWKSFVLGLLALGGGGSIGPEASTSVITSSMINWLGDRLRWSNYMNQNNQSKNIWFNRMQQDELSKAGHFSSLFKNKFLKKITIFLLILVGVVGAACVFKLFPEEGVFGIHHQVINWQWLNLLTAIPALIAGVAFGWFFVHLENWFAIGINERFGKIGQGLIFGAILAASTFITKDMLFSGEFGIVPFSEKALSLSVASLLIIGIGKAIISNLGFVMGWRGGTIFPAIFCSVAIGAACAAVLPGDPRINVIVVMTAALMMILENAPLVIILLLLLVAIELAPVIIGVSLLVLVLLKLSRKLKR